MLLDSEASAPGFGDGGERSRAEAEELCAAVRGVRSFFNVAQAFHLADGLGDGLNADGEAVGELGDGRVAGEETLDDEAVPQAGIAEAGCGEPIEDGGSETVGDDQRKQADIVVRGDERLFGVHRPRLLNVS